MGVRANLNKKKKKKSHKADEVIAKQKKCLMTQNNADGRSLEMALLSHGFKRRLSLQVQEKKKKDQSLSTENCVKISRIRGTWKKHNGNFGLKPHSLGNQTHACQTQNDFQAR